MGKVWSKSVILQVIYLLIDLNNLNDPCWVSNMKLRVTFFYENTPILLALHYFEIG